MSMRKSRTHKRASSLSGFLAEFFDNKPALNVDIDAEKLTTEERLSRSLYSPAPPTNIKENGRLYEHFLVVGLPGAAVAGDPTILYCYPPDTELDLPPGIENFCFPQGVQAVPVSSRLPYDATSFVFLMRNELSEVFYGICAHRFFSEDELPSFHHPHAAATEPATTHVVSSSIVTMMPSSTCTESSASPEALSSNSTNSSTSTSTSTSTTFTGPLSEVVEPEAEGSSSRSTASTSRGSGFVASYPMAYCLVSRFPFFRFHLEALDAVFALHAPGSTHTSVPIVGAISRARSFDLHSQSVATATLSRPSASVRTLPSSPTRVERHRGRSQRHDSFDASLSTSPPPTLAALNNSSTSTASASLLSSSAVPTNQKLPRGTHTTCTMPSASIVTSSSPLASPPETPPQSPPPTPPLSPTLSAHTTQAGRHSSAARQGESRRAVYPRSDPLDMLEPRPARLPKIGVPAATRQRATPPLSHTTHVSAVESSGAGSASSPQQAALRRLPSATSIPLSPRGRRAHAIVDTSPQQTAAQRFERLISTLDSMFDLSIPKPGRKLSFDFAHLANTIKFTRPFFDEEEELFADWGVPSLFRNIDQRYLYKIICAVLLERKVVFVSKSIRRLSTMTLAMTPLLRPFFYQSAVIPILPERMKFVLDAPMPFIVGMPDFPTNRTDYPDIIFVDIDRHGAFEPPATPLPSLPFLPKLRRKLSKHRQELKKTFLVTKEEDETSTEQRHLIAVILTVFEGFFDSYVKDFRWHCIRDLTESKPITVFMKESFLASVDEAHLAFFSELVETQTFFHYSDTHVRKIDQGSRRPSSASSQDTL